MKLYFSTFIAGTQEIIKSVFDKRDSKFKIKLLLDGLVVYKTNFPEREIRNFRFFNNTFLLLKFFESLEPNQKFLEKMVMEVHKDHDTYKELKKNLPVNRKLFKIVTSLENQTVSINRDALKKLESKIQHNTDLRLNIKNSNLELWFLLRREGKGFFGIRITYPYGAEKQRAKGELRRELAHIMCILSQPSPKDVILDPFAGYGAIPLERGVSFPFKKIIAAEYDKKLIDELKLKTKRKNFDIIHGDALALNQIKDNSIDKIITDPPWGMFKEVNSDLIDFYYNMLREFSRILKRNGIVIILIGQPKIFEQSLEKTLVRWKTVVQYPILVSGKKATIYKLTRNR